MRSTKSRKVVAAVAAAVVALAPALLASGTTTIGAWKVGNIPVDLPGNDPRP